ncbi:MAG: putative nucleic acid-binding protein [Planctomycetota bacterium]|jgi:predicted nucleic acid-binding protein
MTIKKTGLAMGLLVDTSVWSQAFRRDVPSDIPEVVELKRALESGASIFVTGLILQELLQGFNKPRAQDQIVEYFTSLPLLTPDWQDYISAAELRNKCWKKGVQSGTIGALPAQPCIHHELDILTTDKDFAHMAKVVNFGIWR